jgi:hypothetical protein
MNFCLVSHIVLDNLLKAKEGFVLISYLHLVYLVILISDGKDPDYMVKVQIIYIYVLYTHTH